MKATFVSASDFAESCGLQVRDFYRTSTDEADPSRVVIRCPGTDDAAKAKIKQFIKDTGLTVVRKRSDRITVGSNYTLVFFKRAAFEKCKVNLTKIEAAAKKLADAAEMKGQKHAAYDQDAEDVEDVDVEADPYINEEWKMSKDEGPKKDGAFDLLKRVSARVQKYGQLRPGHLTADIESFLLGK
jgi:hypothetical protein